MASQAAANRGASETEALVVSVQQQLERLTAQLADCEELREELDDDEYEETRADTLAQMKEFQVSLSKMMSGDVTLVDKVSGGSILLLLLLLLASPPLVCTRWPEDCLARLPPPPPFFFPRVRRLPLLPLTPISRHLPTHPPTPPPAHPPAPSSAPSSWPSRQRSATPSRRPR